jgi:arsenite methyltransferase
MSEVIKEKVNERYGKIASTDNSDCCCMSSECSTGDLPIAATKIIYFDPEELKLIIPESILGVGCGTPIKFVNLQEGKKVNGMKIISLVIRAMK